MLDESWADHLPKGVQRKGLTLEDIERIYPEEVEEAKKKVFEIEEEKKRALLPKPKRGRPARPLPVSVDPDFNLIPWQQKVERALIEGATHIYVKAGRKSGKTELQLYRQRQWAKEPMLTPEQINWYVAPYRNQGKNIFWRRAKSGLGRDNFAKKPLETELAIDMKSGIRFQIFGADHEDAIRGLNFGPGCFDEADVDTREGVFEEVIEPNLAMTKAPCLLSSTPKNRWFTKRWKEARDGLLGRSHVAFHATIYDNPHIDRGFIERIRKNTPKEIWEQEYMANENAYSGLMFQEFNNSHIVSHKTPKREGKFARSIDWGFDHPSHILWAEIFKNEQGRTALYVYRELSLRGKSVQELAKPILSEEPRPFVLSLIDSSAKRREMGTGTSILSEFRKNGVYCRLALRNDPVNINAVKVMLTNDDLHISENCQILIRQLRNVEWGDEKNDDAVDALKYLCGMVYGRDFDNVDASEPEIDPRGILAAPGYDNEDSFEWSPY